MTSAHATSTPALKINRTFNAPRDLVFELWAKEEHLLNWFGPRQYPVTHWSHDFIPGGEFEFVMEGPGGIQAPGAGEYEEIITGERIVAKSRIVDGEGRVIFEVRQTHTFVDGAGGTTDYSLETIILKNEDFPGLAGMEQGWTETLDRFDEYVATLR